MEEGAEQEVTRIVRTFLDGEEMFAIEGKQLVLPNRGSITLHRILHQAMDGINVVALDLTIGTTLLQDIRRVDKKLEDRITRLVRSAGSKKAVHEEFIVRVRLDAIIG